MSDQHQPVYLLSESSAARALDMRPAEFRQLVAHGIMPRPRDIGGLKRWSAEELRAIATGERARPQAPSFEV